MLEKDVEQYLKLKVEQVGGLCLKFTSPSTRGVPDRIIIFKGQVFFVEVKRPGGRLRINQVLIGNKIKQQGIDVYVVDSKEAVDSVLNKHRIGVSDGM